MYQLKELFRNTKYGTSIFSAEEVNSLENIITLKGNIPYIKCIIRKKNIRLTPEEVVRQLYIYRLINEYGYPAEQISLEHPIYFGREIKRADIVIFEKDHPASEYIIIEVKKPKLTEGKEQLKSYCNATGAIIGVWTNGETEEYYHRKEPNHFENIKRIPRAREKLRDVIGERWTIQDLEDKNKLKDGRKSLKDIIQDMEDEVLANAGVDVFEEVFKLIFTKLYDEIQGGRNETRILEFGNYGDTDEDLKANIQALFDRAKDLWQGVFAEDEKIMLSPSHLAICVSSLQEVKLFNSNLDVVDDAFEYLMNKSQKGEKGQFFTPRYVIDMCVRMLNPKEHEYMIDTAAGSCGFPVHTMFYVWGSIYDRLGIPRRNTFTAEKKPEECIDYVRKRIFAIDFDEKAVRVARTLNLIAGDGRTNVLHLNTLDYSSWNESTKSEAWIDIYNEGWKGLRKLREVQDSNSSFMFDIVMANPPFAGDIKESRIISRYELGRDAKGKPLGKVGRDILFIERNLQFLKPGGRMAVILPQGRFNNSSDKYIRDFIAERCRILAVVGLHGNVFKPHTGTKTSVLLVQKWDDELCPYREDYPIFFATMRKPGKDNSGEKIYQKKEDGSLLLDEHNHPVVEHDLYSHDGLTEEGIAEAFMEFARREGLSFFGEAHSEERYAALMSGLECSEVMLSAVENTFTLGAEYYGKNYIETARTVEACGNVATLGDMSTLITDGDHGSPEYQDDGIPYILSETVEQGYIITDKIRYITPEKHKVLSRSALHPRDVIVTKTGIYFGKSAVIPDEIPEANTSSHVAKIALKNGYNPYYVSAFLNCRYGYHQLRRRGIKATRPEIALIELNDIAVPKLSDEFDAYIEDITRRGMDLRAEAVSAYTEAQDILTDALDFSPSAISQDNITVKSFSALSERWDAEYFMPCYDDLYSLLDTLPTRPLGEIVSITKSIEPGSEHYTNEGIPFIRVSDINTTGITTPAIKIPADMVPEIETLYPKKDTILLSKDGSIGIAYKVEENMKAITSGALLHLRVKCDDVLPDYLALVLNSEVVQMQAERYANGAVIKHWKPDDIAKTVIPVLPPNTQRLIADKIQLSFRLRRQSESLITKAIASVELAIEKGENIAIKFLHG